MNKRWDQNIERKSRIEIDRANFRTMNKSLFMVKNAKMLLVQHEIFLKF